MSWTEGNLDWSGRVVTSFPAPPGDASMSSRDWPDAEVTKTEPSLSNALAETSPRAFCQFRAETSLPAPGEREVDLSLFLAIGWRVGVFLSIRSVASDSLRFSFDDRTRRVTKRGTGGTKKTVVCSIPVNVKRREKKVTRPISRCQEFISLPNSLLFKRFLFPCPQLRSAGFIFSSVCVCVCLCVSVCSMQPTPIVF